MLVDATFVNGDTTLECVYTFRSRDDLRDMLAQGFVFCKDDDVHVRLVLGRSARVVDLVTLNALHVRHCGPQCILCIRFALPRVTFRIVHALCRAAGFAYRRDRGALGGWVAPMTEDRMVLLRACVSTVRSRVDAHRECHIPTDTAALHVESFVWQPKQYERPSVECEVPEQRRARELMRETRVNVPCGDRARERKRVFVAQLLSECRGAGTYTADGRWLRYQQ